MCLWIRYVVSVVSLEKSNKHNHHHPHQRPTAFERGLLCESVRGVPLAHARRKNEGARKSGRVRMRERKRMRASLVSPLACALSDLGVSRCVSLGELRLCQVGHVRVLIVRE